MEKKSSGGKSSSGDKSKGGDGPSKVRKIAYLVIIVGCLAGGWLSYSMLSDTSPKETSQTKAAEAKAQVMSTAVEEERKKQQPPPPTAAPSPEVHRGKMAAPK
jgi:hypothetical protein